MGIYIKGMEMPSSCFLCPFKKHAGWVRCMITDMNVEPETVRETKAKSCPLVDVPPHGDLIDSMALLESIKEARKRQPEIEDVYTEDYFIVAEWLMSAPTIIEAER